MELLNYKIVYSMDDNQIEDYIIEINKDNNDFYKAVVIEPKETYGTLAKRTANAIKFVNDLNHMNLNIFLKNLEMVLNVSLGCTKVEIVDQRTKKETFKLFNKEWENDYFNINLNYDFQNETWYLNFVNYFGDYQPEMDQYVDLITFIINQLMEYTNKDLDKYKEMIWINIKYFLKGEWTYE